MQFLLSVIHDRHDLATPEEMAATVVDNRDGEAVVSTGPVVGSTEFVAGFWILEASDLDVALELAAEGSTACYRKIEVRPLL